MWAIVGLGNPGRKYARTRHNVGFMVLEELASRHGVPKFRERPLYLWAEGSIEGERAVFVEPLTFMNRSGGAVREILRKYDIPPPSLIVIHDDLDMETGRLKLKRAGGSGGHRGVQSIIQETGTRDFIRVKLGIGRDVDLPPEDYVLRKFRRNELPALKEAVASAADSVSAIIKEGVESAMNTFNKKP